jgi:hypothetical protein
MESQGKIGKIGKICLRSRVSGFILKHGILMENLKNNISGSNEWLCDTFEGSKPRFINQGQHRRFLRQAQDT